MIAALYVRRRGVYAGRPDVELWDAKRDARRYPGPWPVVAHPPCGPWGPLRGMCTKQDPSCGPAAFEAVRRFGGVLEHPAHSALFDLVLAPRPGELPDGWGGRTFDVEQLAWGHPCVKPTWLYVVGVPAEVVAAGVLRGGTPTHQVAKGPRSADLRVASKRLKETTPPAFADWLVSLAERAQFRGCSSHSSGAKARIDRLEHGRANEV